jgi:hypothetical protein
MAEDDQLTSGDARERVAALSTTLRRAQLAGQLGQQYGGARDLYDALGYQKNLNYADYWTQYSRQDIARAVIDRPVRATWRGGVSLVETTDESEGRNNTPLEQAFQDAWKRTGLSDKLPRVDRLTALGRYGVLLLGLDDVSQEDDFREEIQPNAELVYVKPFGEGSATIGQ